MIVVIGQNEPSSEGVVIRSGDFEVEGLSGCVKSASNERVASTTYVPSHSALVHQSVHSMAISMHSCI